MVTVRTSLVCVVAWCLGAATGCSRDPAAVRDGHLAQGDALFKDSHFPQATVEYQKAVTADPNSSDARQRLAESYVRIGLAEFAIKEYTRAATLAPTRAELQMQAATLLLAARRFEEAEVFARQGVTLAPATGAGHLLLGNALVGLSSVNDATAMVALDPASPGASARFQAAEREYRTAIALEPDGPLPHVALGRLHEALGGWDDAEAEYKRALAIKGADVLARRALARLYLVGNRQKDAEEALVALADSLKTPAGYQELAEYYVSLDRWDDARSLLTSLLDRISTFASARIQLAAVEFQTGHLARAHQLIDEVLEPYPNDPKALLFKARLLRSEGKFAEAVLRARTAVDADRDSVVARRELASLYVATHNRDEALRVLGSAAAALQNPTVQFDLARIYFERKDFSRARVASERALALRSDFIAARALLVRALVGERDRPKAEATLQAIPPSDQSIDVLLARGDVEAARGDHRSARRNYQKALNADPEHVEALTAAVRLDIIDGRLGEPLRRMAGLVRPLAAEVSLAEGRAVAAQAILQALVSETPADADSWVALAAVHQAQGRMSDAQAAAEQAVRLQPAWPHATLTLGAILETQGKSTEARVKYEALLKIDPDAVDVKKRLAR